MTSRPDAAMDTAKFADTVVLPTPPLPPVTAMTLTGRVALSSAKAWARSGDSLWSRIGGCSAEIAGEIGLVARRGRALTELESRPHQPDSLQMGCVQILRYALAIANVGNFQLVPEHRGNDGTETGRLIHFGENAGRGLHAHEGANDFIERLAFCLCRKRQQTAPVRAPELQAAP